MGTGRPVEKERRLLAFLRDYHHLSEVTRKDSSSIAHTDDVLDDIAGSCWLRLLNLCEATGKYS